MEQIGGTCAGVGTVEDPLATTLPRLRAALAGGTRGLSDADLVDLLSDTERLGRLVDAARDELAAEAGERSRASLGSDRLSARRGCRTPSELIERATRVSGRTARERLRRGAMLRGDTALSGEVLPGPLPLVHAARTDGALGTDAVEVISTALLPAMLRGADLADVTAAEEALVGAATGGSFGEDPHTGGIPMTLAQVTTMAQAWALVLDPDGAEPDDLPLDDATLHRFLSLRAGRHGTVRLTGELTVEVGAQLQRLIDAVLNPRVQSCADDVPAGGGEVPAGGGAATPWDPRTLSQRRHDALGSILMTAAAAPGMPALGGAAPTLVVIADASEVGALDGTGFIDGVDEALARVPASVCRQVACSGAVQRVQVDGRGRIVALEAPSRVFTAHQRRAIAARDGHCVIPGCRVPSTWCEVHHVHEWAQGGSTTTDNGVLLCGFHHRNLDTGGWRIRMVDGAPQVSSPAWIDPHRTWTAAEQSTPLRHRGLRQRLGHPSGSLALEDPAELGRLRELDDRHAPDDRGAPDGPVPVEPRPVEPRPVEAAVSTRPVVSHLSPPAEAATLHGILTPRGAGDWKRCTARIPGLSPPWEQPWWGLGPETRCRTG